MTAYPFGVRIRCTAHFCVLEAPPNAHVWREYGVYRLCTSKLYPIKKRQAMAAYPFGQPVLTGKSYILKFSMFA
jgi:hypothetical protein